MLFDVVTKIENIACSIASIKCVIEAIQDAMNYGAQDAGAYTEGLWMVTQALERQYDEAEKIAKVLLEVNGAIKGHKGRAGETIAEKEQ